MLCPIPTLFLVMASSCHLSTTQIDKAKQAVSILCSIIESANEGSSATGSQGVTARIQGHTDAQNMGSTSAASTNDVRLTS